MIIQKNLFYKTFFVEKRRHQFLPIVFAKILKRVKEKERERGGEFPCLKDTTKTIYASNKLISSMQISYSGKQGLLPKGISTIVLMQGNPAFLLRYQKILFIGRLVT